MVKAALRRFAFRHLEERNTMMVGAAAQEHGAAPVEMRDCEMAALAVGQTLSAAGIDDFVYIGCDVLAALRDAFAGNGAS